MSTNATAKIVDETGQPLTATLTATLTDVSAMFDQVLVSASTNNGALALGPYAEDDPLRANEFGARKLRLELRHQTRLVVAPIDKDDVIGNAPIDFGSITVAQREAAGWVVTLGQPPGQSPPFLSQNNAVRLLVDSEEAWGYVAERLDDPAVTEVNIMQLEMDVPKHDEPGIVLKFTDPLDKDHLRPVAATDKVLEVQVEQLVKRGAVVRVLIDDGSWSNILVIIGLALLLLIALPITLILAIVNIKTVAYAAGKAVSILFHSHPDGGVGEVTDYFKTPPTPTVLGFKRTLWNRLHAKLVIIGQGEVIVTGSPFVQNYYDASTHNIDEPRRGWHPDIPIHDVSLGVRGPAVNDMHEAFRLHWNQAIGSQNMPVIPPVAAATAGTSEYASSLQLVRTLNGGVFPAPLANGEQGILEAYLRAIENATDFIYFENQYFTNETIARAIVAALKATPALTAILLLNVIPDIPFYAKWQCALIRDMRTQLGANAATRIGFFTAWSQEAGKIMPNYMHAKVGIVGNDWATVGSANLDGASLDYFQLLHALQFGNNRNHELNYVMLNGHGESSDAIDPLRRRLWSEHLGYATTTASDLARTGAGDGGRFLNLWRTSSQAKINALKTSPGTAPAPGLGRVIEYPADPTWNFKDYLTRSGLSVDGTSLTLVEESRAFSFKNGTWAK